MSDASELSALDPPAHATVVLGEGAGTRTVAIKPLKMGALPAFARALQPLSSEIEAVLRDGLTASAVMRLVAEQFDKLLEALEIASGVSRAELEDLTLEQGMGLVVAVLAANRDFFRGRAATALSLAAGASGAGPTPSKSSSAQDGPSAKSRS